MSKPPTSPATPDSADPSMEDILASIRRILNEDEHPAAAEAHSAETTPGSDVLVLDPSMMVPEGAEPRHVADAEASHVHGLAAEHAATVEAGRDHAAEAGVAETVAEQNSALHDASPRHEPEHEQDADLADHQAAAAPEEHEVGLEHEVAEPHLDQASMPQHEPVPNPHEPASDAAFEHDWPAGQQPASPPVVTVLGAGKDEAAHAASPPSVAAVSPAADLIAPETAAAAASSVDSLVRTLTAGRAKQVYSGGPTLEDLVRAELRPMLKEWLDANLPPVVERLVRIEIEKVVGRAVS